MWVMKISVHRRKIKACQGLSQATDLFDFNMKMTIVEYIYGNHTRDQVRARQFHCAILLAPQLHIYHRFVVCRVAELTCSCVCVCVCADACEWNRTSLQYVTCASVSAFSMPWIEGGVSVAWLFVVMIWYYCCCSTSCWRHKTILLGFRFVEASNVFVYVRWKAKPLEEQNGGQIDGVWRHDFPYLFVETIPNWSKQIKKKNVMITVCDTRRYSYHMIV